jgi:hypothetical protein
VATRGVTMAHASGTTTDSDMKTRITAGLDHGSWDWRLTITSWLLYVLTFNLVFFLQELFLVLPKALTPGLYPTLFHNNHTWTGQNPLQDLLQGTGALTIFLLGTLFASVLPKSFGTSKTWRLFLFWMAYQGLFQSLAQVVIGALIPSNDVGMAMNYLQLNDAGKVGAAILAFGTMAAVGLWLGPHLLPLASAPSQVDSQRKRAGFLLRTATLPAIAGILLIVPFRMPRNVVELVLWPVIVAVAGTTWLQLSAWRVPQVPYSSPQKPSSILMPLLAVIMLLLIFQLVLRPGVRFY